ncbi:MAG: hypothetical protein ACRDHY_04395, partial [Anaerolineales bacterium]
MYRHLRWTGASARLLIAGFVLGACAPQVVTVTREVERIVEVTPTSVDYGELVWLSTQLRPVGEAERVRGVILEDFPGAVEFVPEDEGPFHDRVSA